MLDRHQIVMNFFTRFLALFNLPEVTPPDIQDHFAYKAGYRANSGGNLENPYDEGTEAYRYWQFGYRETRDDDVYRW
jgi:hypothetical protein